MFGFGAPKRKPISEAWDESVQTSPQSTQSKSQKKPISQAFDEFSKGSKALPYNDFVNRDIQKPQQSETIQLKPEAQTLPPKKPSLGETLKSSFLGFAKSGEEAISRVGTALKYSGKANQVGGDRTFLDKVTDPFAIGETKFGRAVKSTVGKAEEAIGSKIEGVYGKSAEYYGSRPGYKPELSSFRDESTGKVSLEKLADPRRLLQVFAEGTASFIPGAVVGAATKNPLAAGAVMGVMEAGDAAQSYAEEIAKNSNKSIEDLTDKEVKKVDEMATYYGIASAALESIFPAQLKRIIGEGGKEAEKSLLRRIFVKAPIESLRAIANEGGTEGVQRFAQNVIAKASNINPGQQLSEGVLDEAIAGAISGVGISAATSIISPGGQDPQEAQNMPIATVEGEAPQGTPEPPEAPKMPQYEAKKSVKSLFSALESDDTESIHEISSKMSKKELTDARAVLEEMQVDEEASSDPDVLEKVSKDIETVDTLIEQKNASLSQEVKNVVEGNPSTEPLHVSDANTVKDIVEQVKGVVDEETKAKIDENLSKVDSKTLPGVAEARALVNENNPFSSIDNLDALEEVYAKKSNELSSKEMSLNKQKSQLLAQKKAVQSREEKKAIQTQIDDLDGERRVVDSDTAILEEQSIAKQLVLVQDTIDRIHAIEPNFNVGKTVDENWNASDYTQYLDGISKKSYEEPRKPAKSRSGRVSRPVELAKGQPEVSAPSPSKYAEEAGRNADAVGDQLRERPSDGRELKVETVVGSKMEQPKKKSAKPAHSKEEIEKLAQSKEYFTREEKAILDTYEGAGATREAGRGLLDEFFTPEEVANKVWEIVFSYRPKSEYGMHVLEPSAGTGRFLAKSLDGTSFTAFETNPTSAKILKTLYPKADVKNSSFETLFIDEKGKKKDIFLKYDVVVGNPPYGNHRGKYKGLGEEPKIGRYEEYFLKRSLDLTKDGGLVALVVPSSFLRSGNDYAKKAISKLGYLVDAYRLPNGIFKGTEVGTDIVIFERNNTDEIGETMRSLEISDDKFFRAPMNSAKVLGKKTLKKNRFGDIEEVIVGNLDEALSKISLDRISALEGVTEEVSESTEKIQEERAMPEEKQLFDVFESFFGEGEGELIPKNENPSTETETKEASWQDAVIQEVMSEGKAYQNSDMEAGYQKFVSIFKDKKTRNQKVKDAMTSGDFETMKKEVSRLGIMRAVDFSRLFHSEEQSESEVFESFRDRLEKDSAEIIYGKRVARNLGKVKEMAIVQGVEAELRPMKRVVKPEKDHIRRDEKRPYVLTSTKKGGVQVIEQVGASEEERYLYENTLEDGSIDPKADFNKEGANFHKGKHYTEINYASGDIYKKLHALEEDFGDGNMNETQYERQKKLLESVLPPKMGIQDISIIPISETAKISLGGVSLIDRFSKWLETLPFAAFEGSNKYQIAGYLNGYPVNVGDKARNREIRKQRRDIGNKLFQKFYKEELPKDFQEKVEERFNKENNSIHTPNYAEYPFSTQLSKTFGGRPLELRPIQMEGASFLVNKGVGILAYEVGVGKTLSAIAAISEVMRRGWAKRPLIVVPKNLRSKWIREIADSIPGVKINDLGNLGADLKFKGDMKEFSIDSNSLSVITEEGFKRIGYSEDTFGKLTRDLQDVTYEKGEKSARASAADDVKAEETVGKARRGTEFPLTFEELGFDHITFDEAHREKNVFAKAQASKEDRKANEYGAVRGAVSERGLKAYLATQYILNENKGRNVFLLTATPFNNSPVEIYSMLSLVAKKRLEDMGIKNINDFISLYIQLETKLAFKADGQYKETDQVRKFQNLQQLQLLVREYIDFRTGEEAGIPRPSKIRKKQFVKMNEMQWNAVKGAQVLFEDKDAGVLKAITELQKITLSPYLSRFSNASMASVSPKVFIENSPKVRYTVEAIKKAHKANPSVGQIVFVEKGVEVFSPMFQHFVKDLKYKPSEVAIMDGSFAEAKRDEIKEKFQNGEIKILMTTIKEGVDLQRNSTDLYNLYLPWNPTDLVQVEGRTWRQGSKYDKVRIHYPLLENSVDVFLFQKLEEKAARLASVFSYKGNDLDVSDIDFEAMKIDLITDPALRAEAEYSLKLTKIENEISRVKSEKSFIEKKAGKIAEINQEISDYTKKVEEYSGYGDSYKDVVASYDRKRSSLKEDLATEISRLLKNGVDMDEIERKMNEKDQELLLASSEKENLSKEKEAKISEAKKAPSKEVYGASDFNELTEGMDDAGFFVDMPGMAFALSRSADPLLQEARKYETPEEFVKAQGTPNLYNVGDSFEMGKIVENPFKEGVPSIEKAQEINKYLQANKDKYNPKYIKFYHGTAKGLPIEEKGLLPTSATRRRSYQSESGYVYLASTPERAKTFGDLGNMSKSDVYEVVVPVDKLVADLDQLNNLRSTGEKVGNSVGESIVYGGGVRIKGKIEPYAIRKLPDNLKTKSQLIEIWKEAHSEPHLFADRSIRGKDGKFVGSSSMDTDKITVDDIQKYLSTPEARAIVEKVKKEINPAIASVLQLKIAEELTFRGKAAQGLGGFFDPQEFLAAVSTAIPSKEERGGLSEKEFFEKILRHEINHAAFALLPREKQMLIEDWYKGLSEKELADIFDGDASVLETYRRMSVSGKVQDWNGDVVAPTTFLADETFNRFMNKKGERTPLQKMMDKIVDAIKRLLFRINSAIFSKDARRSTMEGWYESAFNKRGDVFVVPADLIPSLRSRFVIPGSVRYEVGANMDGGMAFASKNLFGEEVPEEVKERRRIYMRAFEKVLAEKRPPSLGKMVDEAFAIKERRTMITAEKLQTLSEAVEDLAMTEGMQAGYLEGETSAVLAREGEIKELQTKLEGVQHVKERADAVKEELNEKSYDRLKALMTLQRKMERQATRYKEQKESLLKKFNEKKLEQKEKAKDNVKEAKQNAENKAKELQFIREEMYDYVKEHLPRKHWDKYLRFIRDAKTRENLQKLFESVDEDVKKIQRSAVISKIKKILGKAEDLPIQYQLMIKKITEEIDWENMLPSTKEKLKKINEYLEKNPEAETSMPVRILRRLKILSKQPHKTLSTEQLLGLSAKLELIQHVGRIAKASNKANLAKGRADKLALIQKMSTNFDIFKHSGLTREEREKITFWEKSLNALQTTEFQLMPMDYFFYILDGKEEMGTNYQLIKKPIDEAFNGYWKQSTEIKESLSKFIDKLKLESGMEFTDYAWDRIGIHAIRAQKGGTAKLLGSGYDQEAISAVVLNETELAMYGYLRQELDKMFPAIKEVYSRVHNVELEGVDEYFPFLMDWSNRKPVYEELESQYNNKKGVSASGFTIKRVGGGNPVRVHALEAFLKHVDQATYFISLEEATRDVQSLISSHRYAEAVGEKAQAYTQRWLEVVERHGVPVDDKQVAFFDALRRNITLGTLAFKLTTIPIQFGAIFSGAAMIGKSAFSGFGDIVSSKEARAFALESSEQLKMRVGDSPEFTEDIPTERKGALGRKAANVLNTAREYGMWAIKKSDFYTAAGVWLGAYRKKLELSGQEFDMQNVDQDARAYADMVVRMTQGSNEFKDMPPAVAQKYRTFGKLLLQFQNFSLFQWNFARQIVGGNISIDKSKAAWQATMIFTNIVFAMQIRALISRGIWGAPPDDDEESLIASLLWELGQQVPLLGSQLYNLKQFVKNPTYYAAESWQTGVVAIDKTVEAVQAVPKVFAKQKEATREKNIVKAGEAVGNLAGIPGSTQMSQIWRAFLTK